MSSESVSAAVLAAGRASRFGASKLTVQYRGQPLLMHALQAAHGACPGRVTLITGEHAETMTAAAAGLGSRIIHNDNFADGLGSSISCAASAQPDDCNALIILLADQPLITAAHLKHLIERWAGRVQCIVATDTGRALGPPVLFPRAAFPDLCELHGDNGARSILQDARFSVATVACADAAFDVDTADDLRALQQR